MWLNREIEGRHIRRSVEFTVGYFLCTVCVNQINDLGFLYGMVHPEVYGILPYDFDLARSACGIRF